MNIEDFKGIVATYQVGDELRLEALCRAWNREVDEAEFDTQFDTMRNEILDLEQALGEKNDRIAELENQLDNNAQVLAGYRNELVKQNEMIRVLRQALSEN